MLTCPARAGKGNIRAFFSADLQSSPVFAIMNGAEAEAYSFLRRKKA